jgi:nifR3 family TIM-barrel protein
VHLEARIYKEKKIKNVETFKLSELIFELRKLIIEFLAGFGEETLTDNNIEKSAPDDNNAFPIFNFFPILHIDHEDNSEGAEKNSGSFLSKNVFKKSIKNLCSKTYKPALKNSILSGAAQLSDYTIPGQCYSFKIGNLTIRNPVISAPLAGISDNTYRIFASAFGSALTYTEMITACGIHYNHKKSLALSEITDYERPCALQLFGEDPDIIVEAAARLEDRADIIDINMGCPVPKILKAKSGGYLVQDESRVEKIIRKVSSSINKPLTIKTRIGWDRDSINILNIAKIAESSGADAIAIHGRTVKQGFSGEVDYSLIKEVKEKVKIPVIVSGDIDSSKKALEVLKYTGCDGVMVGRAAKGRLWLMANILMAVCRLGATGAGGMDTDNNTNNTDNTDNKPEHKDHYKDYSKDYYADCSDFEPDISWKKEYSKLYLKFLIYFKGEDRAVKEFRKHLCWIFRGEQGVNRVKQEFFKIKDYTGAISCIDKIR